MADDKAIDKIKALSKLFFLYTVRGLIPHLPRRLVMRLAEITGGLDMRGAKAALTSREVGRMLGPEASPELVREVVLTSMREFHKDLFEIWSFPRLNPRRMNEMAWLDGREHLDAALAKGGGAIVGVTHFGSWKVLIGALGYAGYKVNQVAVNPLRFAGEEAGWVNNIIMGIEHRCEQSLPAKFIYLGAFVRDIYRALDRNEVVIMSLDGVERRQQTPIPMLSMQTALDLTPFHMAARKGVDFLPCFPLRQADDRHRVLIHPPLAVPEGRDHERAAREMLLAYGRIMEGHVRDQPSHYARSLYVFVTRWKEFVDRPAVRAD